MKYLIILLFTLTMQEIFAQNALQGRVFNLNALQKNEDESRVFRQIIKNERTDFMEKISIHHSTLKPGHKLRPAHAQESDEELIIIQEGTLTVTINDQTKELGAGSVLLIMPKDMQQMNNLSKSDVSYYVLIYKSKTPKTNQEIAKSQMIDWNTVAFKPHDKGGRRDFFDRPTAMFNRVEMHVTTLNEGLNSHPPHKHIAEEMILLVNGNARMQIGENFYEGSKGDLFFLPSNQLHNLINIGKGSTTYFAFQFN
ncbi:cupin domain-containing protein [Lacihabitans sp. CCS-44]|uniref:cupin domain-containing protein n=1 Tax=Lacihabitans sp. CCS-44 TaxID=2487331 RepID=UPI0020CF57CC|nr:cupin domain-containing protein [Lacihabitans sp. CCS-44]MCP9755096.1 cupin domain-containing protein [Lacihabitans sp. CCS-44]